MTLELGNKMYDDGQQFNIIQTWWHFSGGLKNHFGAPQSCPKTLWFEFLTNMKHKRFGH